MEMSIEDELDGLVRNPLQGFTNLWRQRGELIVDNDHSILAHRNANIPPGPFEHINGSGNFGHLDLDFAEVLLSGSGKCQKRKRNAAPVRAREKGAVGSERNCLFGEIIFHDLSGFSRLRTEVQIPIANLNDLEEWPYLLPRGLGLLQLWRFLVQTILVQNQMAPGAGLVLHESQLSIDNLVEKIRVGFGEELNFFLTGELREEMGGIMSNGDRSARSELVLAEVIVINAMVDLRDLMFLLPISW